MAYGLEVVRGREVRDVRSELPALHVRGAEVEARPDARLDELVERLIEAAERSRDRRRISPSPGFDEERS